MGAGSAKCIGCVPVDSNEDSTKINLNKKQGGEYDSYSSSSDSSSGEGIQSEGDSDTSYDSDRHHKKSKRSRKRKKDKKRRSKQSSKKRQRRYSSSSSESSSSSQSQSSYNQPSSNNNDNFVYIDDDDDNESYHHSERRKHDKWKRYDEERQKRKREIINQKHRQNMLKKQAQSQSNRVNTTSLPKNTPLRRVQSNHAQPIDNMSPIEFEADGSDTQQTHPRLNSVQDFDPNTLEIAKSLFDPNYQISTINANTEQFAPSTAQSVRSVPASVPVIPYHHNSEYQIMTPPASTNNNNAATHRTTQSYDFINNNFPNTPPFSIHGPIKNDDTTPQLPAQNDDNELDVQRRRSAPNIKSSMPTTPIFDISQFGANTDPLSILFQTEPPSNDQNNAMNPDDNDQKENHKNKSDEENVQNISPKQSMDTIHDSSSFKPSVNKINVNVNETININKPTSNIQIHGKDPNAAPCSPPIHSVYKPIPNTYVSKQLSFITESDGGGSPTDTTKAVISSIKHHQETIPETDMIITQSNESELFAAVTAINEETSLPSDDDDLVAKQWMDLHHAAGGIMPSADNDTSNFKYTDISSDDVENEAQVKEWKRTMANMKKMDVLTTNIDANAHSFNSQNTTSSGNDTASAAPAKSSDEDDAQYIGRIHHFGGDISSKYSSSTSDELNEDETINMPNGGGARHSTLLRAQSMEKWSRKELSAEAKDMKKELKHLTSQFESKHGLIKDPKAATQWIDQ